MSTSLVLDSRLSKYCCEGKWINSKLKKELQQGGVGELEQSLEEDKDWNIIPTNKHGIW